MHFKLLAIKQRITNLSINIFNRDIDRKHGSDRDRNAKIADRSTNRAPEEFAVSAVRFRSEKQSNKNETR